MSDRELLEMAAKAAGLRVKWVEFWNAMKLCDLVSINGAKMRKWNPLTDDGDALRLAVTLREKLGTEITSCFGIGRFNSYRSDPFAATRLAIVRAAAEIGKAEPRAAATTPVLEPAQATQAASAEDMKVYASIADRYFREATQTELTDKQIREAATKAVKDGKLSWLGFEKDDQDKYTIPVISKSHYQFARAILALRPERVPMTDEQILEIAEPFGEFQYGDAQGHKRIDFARAILALRPQAVPVPMTEGTARQFVEWMKAQPDDRVPTTIDGALAEFEAHHSITTKAKGDQ